MNQVSYKVRRYHPNYCDGIKTEVMEVTSYDDILKVPFIKRCEDYFGESFIQFKIKEYYADELIISVFINNPYTKEEENWVIGFAIPMGSPRWNEWRYNNHVPNLDRMKDKI